MIASSKRDGQRWAYPIAVAIVRRVMRRRFCGVWALGIDHLPQGGEPHAILACAGHTNWWDGFTAGLVSATCFPGRLFSAMQEERHLAKYSFFKLAGVFGINLDGSPIAGFREAIRRLRNPRALLWMFPQGRFCSSDERVIIRAGAIQIAKRADAAILPVWFHYVWMFESKPAIVIEFAPMIVASDAERLEDSLEKLRLSTAWKQASEMGREILPPVLSLNKVWEKWARRLRIIRPDHPFELWNR